MMLGEEHEFAESVSQSDDIGLQIQDRQLDSENETTSRMTHADSFGNYFSNQSKLIDK
jgi:hypothetical protein